MVGYSIIDNNVVKTSLFLLESLKGDFYKLPKLDKRKLLDCLIDYKYSGTVALHPIRNVFYIWWNSFPLLEYLYFF